MFDPWAYRLVAPGPTLESARGLKGGHVGYRLCFTAWPRMMKTYIFENVHASGAPVPFGQKGTPTQRQARPETEQSTSDTWRLERGWGAYAPRPTARAGANLL